MSLVRNLLLISVGYLLVSPWVPVISASSEFLPYASTLAQRGIIRSQSLESGYRLTSTLSRAEGVKMALAAAGVSQTSCQSISSLSFSDVTASLGDLCGYIEGAVAQNIIEKTTRFYPNFAITRGDFADIIVRSFDVGAPETIGTVDEWTRYYTDVPTTLPTALSINRLATTGCLNVSLLAFRPYANITRGEAFKMMGCLVNKSSSGTTVSSSNTVSTQGTPTVSPSVTNPVSVTTSSSNHIWSTSSYGTCSKTCGEWVQTRTITCKNTTNDQIVADSYCIATGIVKPVTQKICTVTSCKENTNLPASSVVATSPVNMPTASLVTPTWVPSSSGWSYQNAQNCLNFGGDIYGPLYYADPNKTLRSSPLSVQYYNSTAPEYRQQHLDAKSPFAEMAGGLWITNFTRWAFILDEKNFALNAEVKKGEFTIGWWVPVDNAPASWLSGVGFEVKLYECVNGKRVLVDDWLTTDGGRITFVIWHPDNIKKFAESSYYKTVESMARFYFLWLKPNTLYIVEYVTYGSRGRIDSGLLRGGESILVKDTKKELGGTSFPTKAGTTMSSPVDCFRTSKWYAWADGFSEILSFKDSAGNCKQWVFRCEKWYVKKGSYYLSPTVLSHKTPASIQAQDALVMGTNLYTWNACTTPNVKLGEYYGTPRSGSTSDNAPQTNTSTTPGWQYKKVSASGYDDFSPIPPVCKTGDVEWWGCNAGSVCLMNGLTSALVCTDVSGAKLNVQYSKTTLKATGDSFTVTVTWLTANNFQGCRAVLAHPVASNVNPYKCDNSPQFSDITSGSSDTTWRYSNGTWKITVNSDPASLPAGAILKSHYRNKDTGEIKSVEWKIVN